MTNKYRVHELAKEFTTSSKVILDILDRNNMPAKNHMASIEEDAYQILVRTFALKPDTAEEIRERQRKKATLAAPVAKPEPPKAPPAPPKVFYGGGGQQRPQMNRIRPEHGFAGPQQPVPNTPTTAQQQHQPVVAPKPVMPKPISPEVHRTPQIPEPVQAPVQPTAQTSVQQQTQARIQPPVQSPSQTPVQTPAPVAKPATPAAPAADRPANRLQSSAPYQPRPFTPPARDALRPANASGTAPFRPAAPQQYSRPPFNSAAGAPAQRPGFNQPGQTPRPEFSQPAGQTRPAQPSRPLGARPPVAGAPASSGNAPARPGQTPARPGQTPARPGQTPARRPGDRPQGPGQGPGSRPQGNRPAYQGQGGGGRPTGFRGRNAGPAAPPAPKQEPVRPKLIKIGESLSVKELASKLGREVNEVIKKLMMLGVMATINQEVDFDTASLIAGEFAVTVEELPPEIDPTVVPEIEDDPSTLVHRPPVVTVMGHVDHGKTSLLDAIRQTHVTSQEAGGITQHIGAYQVVQQGKKIVFLDTPGHEAFTSMRARGAQVTDIAILVVAADDGVMPQTIEAINHAKAAKVPIIVAINKMDKPDANPERVQQQLTEYGLVAEAWGGDTIMAPVSAAKKTGINELLEMILLVAEVQDLKANPNRPAIGTIVEAELDKGKGPVATVLVQNGTLRIGDTIIAGTAFGKVRAMTNDRGEKVKKAPPSTPVEVIGLSDVPQAGDILSVVDERTARGIAEKRMAKNKADSVTQGQKVTLEDLFQQIQAGNIKDLNLLVKADVQGSIEALRQSLESLKNKEVRVMIVHSGVGAINESDVMLASASNALIIGFNVRPDANARRAAETEKVDMRMYRVIYDAINDVEAAMTGMLAPEFREVILGRVEVRQVFNIPKGIVAGSYVLEGKITSTSQIRLLRNGIVVHEGKLDSLRRFKDDVKEVAAGYECGITLEKYRDVKEGDIVEAFVMEQIPR